MAPIFICTVCMLLMKDAIDRLWSQVPVMQAEGQEFGLWVVPIVLVPGDVLRR